LWFVKSRRAQTVDDDETWIEGGVTPTLNAFDIGDTRATVLIIETPVLMRGREGKPGGGKGPLLSEDISLTIATNNDQVLFTPGVLIIDGTRVGDVRIYEDDISQTVISRWGTGGGNVPYVFPIQDGRDMEKNQNGLGVGDDTNPSYTLDQTGAQFVAYAVDSNENGSVNIMNSLTTGQNSGGTQQVVAYPIQSTVIGRQDHNGPQGKGYGMETDPMFTLDRAGAHGVAIPAVAYDEFNDSIAETHHTLRAGTQQSTGAIQNAVVRRLTPTECERLQGFPDGWTEDQADSHRYKQMGNAVTVNVISWIGSRL